MIVLDILAKIQTTGKKIFVKNHNAMLLALVQNIFLKVNETLD
jgi:hypothetical protein